MLLDMVTDILAVHPEMMVSGTAQEAVGICTTVKKCKADVVILSEPVGRKHQDYSELLHSRPHLKVFSITSDGHRFFLHQLKPHRTALGEISPVSLIEAIRSSAQQRLS
jgi:hypothetical protein